MRTVLLTLLAALVLIALNRVQFETEGLGLG